MEVYFKDEKKHESLFWLGLFLLMIISTYFFGIEYYEYLDDYNTYGIFYRRSGDIWNDVIMWYKLYTIRPFAFFADAYITQWFWHSMEIVLLFFTTMHFFTILLFYKVLKISKVNLSVFGISILCLCPVLLESTYWIGASTRLVPGVFFSVLSTYIFVKFLLGGKKRLGFLILFFVLNFLSTGFYEQIITFNFVFTCIIILLNFKKISKYKVPIISIPFISTILMGGYYFAFRNSGKVLQRGSTVSTGIIEHTLDTLYKIKELFFQRTIDIYETGIKSFPFSQFGVFQYLLIILIIVLVVFVFYSCKNISYVLEEKNFFLKIIMGIVVLFSSFAPFFLLSNNYLALRTIYPAFFGFILIIDSLFFLVYKNVSIKGKYLLNSFVAFVILVNIVVTITEIENYRLIEIDDKIIGDNFISALESTEGTDENLNILFNSKNTYSPVSRNGFENITSSDWGMLGLLNATYYDYYFKKFLLVPNGSYISRESLDGENNLFFIDDNMNIMALELKDNFLYGQKGEKLGQLIEGEGDVFSFQIE